MCYDCKIKRERGLKDFECRLQVAVDGIHAMMERPGSKPLISNQLKQRADYRRSIANQITRDGGKVKEGYNYDN
jgi:hypothetical protein